MLGNAQETDPLIPLLVVIPHANWGHLPEQYRRHILTSEQVTDLINEAHSMNDEADDLRADIEQLDVPLPKKMAMLAKVDRIRGRAKKIFDVLLSALGVQVADKDRSKLN